MTKALTEADGPSWREKLPPIPTVPLSVREKLTQKTSVANDVQQKSTDQQTSSRAANQKGELISRPAAEQPIGKVR